MAGQEVRVPCVERGMGWVATNLESVHGFQPLKCFNGKVQQVPVSLHEAYCAMAAFPAAP